MNVLPRYEANALMADSTVHRNAPTGASGEEIERRNRDLYRNAVAVVVHRQEYTQANKGAAMG